MVACLFGKLQGSFAVVAAFVDEGSMLEQDAADLGVTPACSIV